MSNVMSSYGTMYMMMLNLMYLLHDSIQIGVPYDLKMENSVEAIRPVQMVAPL